MTKKQVARLIRLINYRFDYLISLDSMSEAQLEEYKELSECFLALVNLIK